MVKLTTKAMAQLVAADNVDASQRLPEISLIEALLPRNLQKRLQLNEGVKDKPLEMKTVNRQRTTYVDVRKGAHGNKQFVAHKEALPGKDKVNGEANAKQENDAAKAAVADKDPDEWTAEEDKKLIDLKDNHKQMTWAQIGEAVGGRDKDTAKARYRELTKNNDNPGTKNNKQDPGPSGKDGKDDKNNKNDKTHGAKQDQNQKQNKKQKGQQKQDQQQDGGKETKQEKGKGKAQQKSKADDDSDFLANHHARFSMQQWQALQADDTFSFDELQCLSDLLAEDSRQSWTRVSSAFYDATGRRVHSEDIRVMFERMGRML